MIIPKLSITPKKAIFLMVLCTLFTSLGQILLKKGLLNVNFNVIMTLLNWPLFLGFCSYGLGALLMMIALKNGELSLLYPILATSYVWVSLLSPMFFQDAMNLWKWLGVMIILFSISLLGYGSTHNFQSSEKNNHQTEEPKNNQFNHPSKNLSEVSE
jgi:undecaprenyl phosphate-alpha-L-ara4N flippase subunit ArnE